MAQTRYTTWKAAVESFPLGQADIGFIKPGRYNGYDIFASEGGLDISLNHSGQIDKTLNNGAADNNFGALVMPTGIKIHDTDQVLLTIATNAGNANTRTDLVICEHNYQQLVGGTTATYSIIQGAGDGSVPVLSNPTKQVIIGRIEFNPNGTTFADMTYTLEPVPLLGDMDAAALYAWIASLVNQDITNNGGEANTASNVGGFTGIFKSKSGVNLQFKTLRSSDGTVTFTANADDIDLKVNFGGVPVVTISGATTLTDADHNGKVIRVLGDNYDITIPAGLASNFECMFFGDTASLPSLEGIYPFAGVSPSNINFVSAASVKVRSTQGLVMFNNLGGTVWLKSPGIANYFVLIGDLTS